MRRPTFNLFHAVFHHHILLDYGVVQSITARSGNEAGQFAGYRLRLCRRFGARCLSGETSSQTMRVLGPLVYQFPGKGRA